MEQASMALVLAAVVITRLAASGDTSPYVQYPLIGVSALVGIGAIYRLYRSVIRPMGTELERLEVQTRRARREAAVEQWRREKLLDWLRGEGIGVPDEVKMAVPPLDWLRIVTGDERVGELE